MEPEILTQRTQKTRKTQTFYPFSFCVSCVYSAFSVKSFLVLTLHPPPDALTIFYPSRPKGLSQTLFFKPNKIPIQQYDDHGYYPKWGQRTEQNRYARQYQDHTQIHRISADLI